MYKLNEEKMFADITDNVAVIINSETGIYYGINNCGSIIFQNIMDGCSVDSIINVLKKIENCPNDIDKKLQEFIDELIKKEIIIEGETLNKNLIIDEKIVKQDNFEMKVSEYADAQEMLLADPIHDVDENEGWQPIFKEDKNNDDK